VANTAAATAAAATAAALVADMPLHMTGLQHLTKTFYATIPNRLVH